MAFVSMHPGDLRLLSQPWLWSNAGEDNKVTAFTERWLSTRHCAQRLPGEGVAYRRGLWKQSPR